MKKVLSLVLVIAMVLSSMSFAFAGTFTDVDAANNYYKAIETLKALKVVDGYEDGTFKAEKAITRAEMAKLMVQLLGYGDLVTGSKSNFSDTQGHWADAWIALAAGRGIVVGTGDGKFTPDRTVSYDEAITMVVRGLGYTDNCNEMKGTWPTNYKVKAAELKLTKDVKLATSGADRGGVAQLMYNALEAALVSVDTDGNVTKLFDTVNEKTVDGKIVAVQVIRPLLSRLATKVNFEKVTPDYLDEDSKLYAGNIVDLAPYMYQDIDVYVNDDDEVVYVAKVHTDILTGEFRKTLDDDDKVKFEGKVNVRIDGKNKAYKLAGKVADDYAIPVYYNGVQVVMTEQEMEVGREDGDTTKAKEIVDLHKAAATFVLNDDKEIVGIIADKYTAATRVTNEYNGKTKFEGYMLPTDDDDKVDYEKLTVKGAVDSLEDIEEDDVIVLYAGAGLVNSKSKEAEKLVIEVVRNTVEGKITETNKDGDFLIDGKYYAKSIYAASGVVEIGDEGIFFLDSKGAILDFEAGSESNPVDYAVVVEFWNGYAQGNGKEVKPEITVVNGKGEEVTYKVKSSAKIKVGGTEKPLLDSNGLLIQELVSTNNTVVKYSINSKNEITAMTLVKAVAKTAPGTEQDTTKSTFVLAKNVMVFNQDGDDVKVVDSAKLGEKVKVLYKDTNKNGEINFLFVKGLGSSDTYAFITSAGTALNSDDVKVQKLTAYVGGEKRTYLTSAIDTVTKSAIDAYTIYKLDLDGDVVEGLTAVTKVNNKPTQLLANETEVTRVNGNRIRIGSGNTEQWFTLSSEAAVYVLDSKEFDSVGAASSVYNGAKVAAYSFDEDNIDDNVIEILFVFE